MPSTAETPVVLATRVIDPTATVGPEVVLTPTAPAAERSTLARFVLGGLIEKDARLNEKQRANEGVDYDRRVDRELNAGRLNIVIWGSGISHEPPYEKLQIASPLVISIDYVHNRIDLISITHDVWVPFIDRTLGVFGQPGSAQRLDQAILNKEAAARFGDKFSLSKRVLEDATGLAVNFQVHLDDSVIERFVNEVTERSLVIGVPVDMPLAAYYMGDGIHYPNGWVVPKGSTRLNASDVVGYIKSVPTVAPGQPETEGRQRYDPRMEHSARRAAVVMAILNYGQGHLTDPGFLFRFTNFIGGLNDPDQFSSNFDIRSIGLSSLSALAANSGSLRDAGLELPALGRALYAVDPCCTTDTDPVSAPLRWSEVAVMLGNQSVRRARDRHVFRDGLSYEVPLGADPFNNDDIAYFGSVRIWVKEKLTYWLANH